ncbi:MAG: undecaprenyl-diphosphate phosphatase [Candidatus Korobacteraceae bacterium]
MNEYLLAVLLGIIEGITEFLPVSSTAHLRIAQDRMGVDMANGYWKTFAVVIQLGAILCLPFYFRKRIVEFVSTFPRGAGENHNPLTHPLSLTVLAFVVTAVPSFLLTKVIGENLESLVVMAASLVVGGIVMWVIDAMYDSPSISLGRRGKRTAELGEMSALQAIWIGLCQVLAAVFPGTSRSMATIAAGQLAGMTRAAALEFSFFLSMPTMMAATSYDLLKTFQPGENPLGATVIDGKGWTLLAIGFLVSFVVAYVVVAWFMRWVRTRGFVPFAIYRIAFGLLVLAWALGSA